MNIKREIGKMLVVMIDDFIAEKKSEGKIPTLELMKKEIEEYLHDQD